MTNVIQSIFHHIKNTEKRLDLTSLILAEIFSVYCHDSVEFKDTRDKKNNSLMVNSLISLYTFLIGLLTGLLPYLGIHNNDNATL